MRILKNKDESTRQREDGKAFYGGETKKGRKGYEVKEKRMSSGSFVGSLGLEHRFTVGEQQAMKLEMWARTS